MQLRAGTARTGRTGRPEVALVLAVAIDLRVGQADLLPLVVGEIVVGEHGGDEPLRRNADHVCHEFPGPRLRLGLEVVAEREVAQHLEHRQMRSVADLVDVSRAKALLDRCQAMMRRLRLAEEVRLERHHAGTGEEQRGVPGRRQRCRRNGEVVAINKKIRECLANRLCVHSSEAALRVQSRTRKQDRAERGLQFPSIRSSSLYPLSIFGRSVAKRFDS